LITPHKRNKKTTKYQNTAHKPRNKISEKKACNHNRPYGLTRDRMITSEELSKCISFIHKLHDENKSHIYMET